MTQQLQVCLVGLGNHGSLFKDFVNEPGTDREPLMEIVRLVDTDLTRLRQGAIDFGIPETACFTSLRDMFTGTEKLDAVIVATPAGERQPVLDALRAGLHVFVENPLALSVATAREIIIASQTKVCTVNEQWVLLPTVKRMVAMVKGGHIGELCRVVIGGKGRDSREEFERIGTHLLNVAIQHFCGHVTVCSATSVPMAKKMEAIQATYITEKVPLIAEFWPRQYDVRRCFMELHGTKGRLKAFGGFLESLWHSDEPYDTGDAMRLQNAGWRKIPVEGVEDIKHGEENKALRNPRMNPTFELLRGFAKAIMNGSANPSPPEKCVAAVEALELTFRSADTRKEIRAEPTL